MIKDKKQDIPLIKNPQILYGVDLAEVMTVMTDNEFKTYEKHKAEETSKNIKILNKDSGLKFISSCLPTWCSL